MSPSTGGRIPSLDGARGVAVILVVIAHLASSGTFEPARIFWRVDLGNLGVRIFFVISGFIITTLLMVERERFGAIDLRRFYIRRFFRILPAFWVYLGFVFVAQRLGWTSGDGWDIAKGAGFVSNYLGADFTVGHSWSLAVEEQFYWLWPAAVVLASAAGAQRVAIGAALAAPLFRLASAMGYWPTNPRYAFESVCDALAVGCLLALMRTSLWDHQRYRALVQSRFWLLFPVIVVGLSALHPPAWAWDAVGITVLNLAVAFSLDHVMRFPNDLVGRVLNWRPVATLGLASYSVYLWQQFWLDERRHMAFPLNVLALAALVVLSYLIVERPLIRVGQGLQRLLPRRETADRT